MRTAFGCFKKKRTPFLLALPLLCIHGGAQTVAYASSLADLSLEQLSQVQVTSVSGRPENLRDAAASVFVITAEDIRRSAATSLPEALRLAPNLHVARTSAGQYAISASCFNNSIANKLLVLIDGRTIYSTLFAGVFWDMHDLVLEDIERIEVISGPGGTLWGANAVNGVINVITKASAETQGGLVSVTRSHHGGQESLRWGGRVGEIGHFRAYALATDRDNTTRADGVERPDAASKRQLGFRSDVRAGGGRITVQGDIYRGGDDPANNLAPKMHGANLLARWDSHFADGSPWQLQAYYDRSARDDVNAFRNQAESFDLQFRHEPQIGARQQLLWGGGWRTGKDSNDPSALVRFIPDERRLSWANVFGQYQRQFDRWQLTLGAKAERNSYTGVEFLPSLRLAWQHPGGSTSWGAISRTVRAPARVDRDFFLPVDPPYIIAGGPDFQSEVAKVVEFGHRGNAGPDLSYSFTLFRQQFKGLRAGLGMPALISNRIEGHVDGVEGWAQWQPAPFARFSAGYLGLRKDLRFSEGPEDPVSIPNLGNDPRHQWLLRSQFDLSPRVELDFHLRRVGALPAPAVPAYTALDARLGWQLRRDLELSLLAQNLLGKRHSEFEGAAVASEFDRRLYLRLVWRP